MSCEHSASEEESSAMSCPKSIFITGCSRGLGLGLVRHILSGPSLPEHLIASCTDPPKAEELQDLAKIYSCLKIVPLDVTSDSDIQAAFEKTSTIVGDEGLNLLINNAGIFLDKSDGDNPKAMTRERMQLSFNVNATTPLLVTQQFLPLLQKAAERNKTLPISCQRAAVLNVSSIMSSIVGVLAEHKHDSCYYRTSKAALNMLTALMSVDLKDSGILVAAVHPGWVKTDTGGPSADLDIKTCAEDIWSVVTEMDSDSSGVLYNHDGTVISY